MKREGAIVSSNFVPSSDSSPGPADALSRFQERAPLLLRDRLVAALGSEDQAFVEWERCRREGIQLLVPTSPLWSTELSCISRPPRLLYLQGAGFPPTQAPVAVVGSRRCSPLGVRQAYRLGRDLAEHGLTVISGLARGIDASALEGAVAGGAAPGAVLGNGLPGVYPTSSRRLANRILDAGGFLLSECPLDTPPRRQNFPRRNRIISALSLAVVVVEAAPRSGSLITVNWALQQGREVLVYPGPVEGPHYEGSHQLLRDGATLVTQASDVIQALAGTLWTPSDHSGWAAVRARAKEASDPAELMKSHGLTPPQAAQAWAQARRPPPAGEGGPS